MLDAFLSQHVMPVDQLARSSTEQAHLCSAGSGTIAQLLHLASHPVFGECCFVEVGPTIDVAVPLDPTFFVVICAFIIEKPADKWSSRSTRCGYPCSMADVHSPEQRRRNMASVRGRDTAPELALRRILTRLGIRYRLHRSDLPGKPDLVFASRRKVIFVHGCFWHSHSCKAGRAAPRTNATFWAIKRGATVERDRRNVADLRAAGWEPLIVWQCQLRKPSDIEQAVLRFLTSGEAAR